MPSRSSLLQINKFALRYFTSALRAYPNVVEYVNGRLPVECSAKFGLGYAPKNSGFIDMLNANNISAEDTQAAGLIYLDENNEASDVFYDRVMIPVIHAGWLVGFAGRALNKEAKSKYINTPATLLYNKRDILFGLWYARRAIEETGFAIILEGYFDWLTLYWAGIRNVVALCGTAFTEQHMTALSRYAQRFCLLLDSDETGMKRSAKIVELLTEKKYDAWDVKLPEGQDPDEFLKTNGADETWALVQGA